METLKYVPGFRSGQTWKRVVASIFYAFAIIVGFADGFGSFLLMVGIFLFACSIVDLILHGFRKKKDTPIKQAIILLIVAFALMITGGGLVSPNEDAKVAEAEALYDQAEAYINEGKIDEALKAIDRSKQLNPNKEENKVFWLEEKIQKLNSDDFMKETLVNMSDADFNLLKNGELKTVFIDHEELNSMFLNKVAENADKRAEYLAEIAEQKRIAEEEAKEKRQEEVAEQKKLADETKEKIIGCIGESEEITEVIIDDKNIIVEVELGDNGMLLPIEELALSRYSSITDKLLEDNFWNDITVDFEDIGTITMNSKQAKSNEYGKYFDSLDIENNFKPKN